MRKHYITLNEENKVIDFYNDTYTPKKNEDDICISTDDYYFIQVINDDGEYLYEYDNGKLERTDAHT